jgi:hypothetical protein
VISYCAFDSRGGVNEGGGESSTYFVYLGFTLYSVERPARVALAFRPLHLAGLPSTDYCKSALAGIWTTLMISRVKFCLSEIGQSQIRKDFYGLGIRKRFVFRKLAPNERQACRAYAEQGTPHCYYSRRRRRCTVLYSVHWEEIVVSHVQLRTAKNQAPGGWSALRGRGSVGSALIYSEGRYCLLLTRLHHLP